MSKKNHCKKHGMDKGAGKQRKHICDCAHSRMPLLPGVFPGVVLNVKNLHLHLDEHMETTSFYRNGCCCDDEDSVVANLDEMAERVAEKVGVDKETVRKVLAAEEEYLTGLGVCEIMNVEEASDEDNMDADRPNEKQDEPAESEVGNNEQESD